MITPELALNFTTATLDPRITFARSGDTATVTDQIGAIVLVNADVPRFDYAAGVCRGLLIEEQRENLLLNSVFDGAVAGSPGTAPTNWLNLLTTGTIASVTAGIYAGGNAVRITHTNLRRAFYRVQSLSANTVYTYSATVTVHSTPAAGFPRISDCVNVSGQPAGSTVAYLLNGASATSSTAIPNGQTSRIQIVIAVGATGGNTEMRWGLGVGGNIAGDVSIQMPQLEIGSRATSYIPTTTTALTRNADVATITGSNFSDFWQASKGGAEVQVTPSTITGIRPLVQYDDGTANNIIALRGNAADPELQIVDGGAPQVQLDAGTIVANTSYSLTGWWSTNDCKARQNSGATVSDYTAVIPTVTQARLGSDGTNYLNGHLATIDYYTSFFGQPIYTRRKNKVFASLL